jgi:nitrate reductase NapAB chaperone NapD
LQLSRQRAGRGARARRTSVARLLLNLAAMVVSALVVTLHPDAETRAATLAQLAADPRLELGPCHRDRLPVVSETDSTAAGAQLVDELQAIAGVARVDVVSIDFEVP